MYAWTKIEVTGPRGGTHIYNRGEKLPDGIDLKGLVSSGAAGKAKPANDPSDDLYSRHLHGPSDPRFAEGLRSVEASDNGNGGDAR